MTIRQDAARAFSNLIIGKTLPYKVTASPDIQAFVDRQELPKGSSINSHQAAWAKMFMAFGREYPDAQPEFDHYRSD